MNNGVSLVVIYSFGPRKIHVIISRSRFSFLHFISKSDDCERCFRLLVYEVTDRTKWPSTKYS